MGEAELRANQSRQTALDEGTPSPEQVREKICRQGLDNSGNIEALPTKETSVATLFRRRAARRGKQRAMIAVAHAILVSVFSILVRHEPYRELGATHFDRLRHSQSVERLTRRLEQ